MCVYEKRGTGCEVFFYIHAWHLGATNMRTATYSAVFVAIGSLHTANGLNVDATSLFRTSAQTPRTSILSLSGAVRTGTSFLPEETIERAKEGNPIEKVKLAKDGTSAFTDVYDFAKKIREGSMTWEEVETADMDTRLKWVGMLHRAKRTPGRFMFRLRTPNGIVTSEQMRFYADTIEPYGPELGVVDITTRQNMQLRGVPLEDADKIIDGLHALNQTSLQSALDNVRNMVGSPLAGIDDMELVDTRPICEALNDLISLNVETGERGNPVWGNLPRKFNIAVSGSRDDYAHTHINDIGLQPHVHAKTGEMGFNVVLVHARTALPALPGPTLSLASPSLACNHAASD